LRYDFDAAQDRFDALVGKPHGKLFLVGLAVDLAVAMPSSRAARTMRTAISPRLAMRSFWMVMDGLRPQASIRQSADRPSRPPRSRRGTYELGGQTRFTSLNDFMTSIRPDRVVSA